MQVSAKLIVRYCEDMQITPSYEAAKGFGNDFCNLRRHQKGVINSESSRETE